MSLLINRPQDFFLSERKNFFKVTIFTLMEEKPGQTVFRFVLDFEKRESCEYCFSPAKVYDSLCGLYYCYEHTPEESIYNDGYLEGLDDF